MIFMVIIGALAIGFYSTITTSTTLAQNDQKGARALIAAESGIQFMRLSLARATIPGGTTTEQLLTELDKDLRINTQLIGNLGAQTVGFANNTISIPAQAGGLIVTDPGDQSGFSVKITPIGGGTDGIVCTVTGHSGSSARTHRSKDVRLYFVRRELPSSIFDGAVAANGKITITKGAIGGVPGISPDTIASITSLKTTSPAFMMTGGTIGGDVNVVGAGLAAISAGSVGGTTNLTSIMKDHVKVVVPPELPFVDTSVLAGYATNTFTGVVAVMNNTRIPANTGTAAAPLKFNSDVLIQGILYVESPNIIEFSGNSTLAGIIVFENKGNATVNKITFTGNSSVANLPLDPMFDQVRSIKGLAMLAPTAALTFTGSNDSNLRGNLIVGTFNEKGSANITIDKGSVIAMDPGANAAVFAGKMLRFTETGKFNQPSIGVKFTSKLIPANGTYLEVN
ncbi:MAG: hypothetical protein QOF78_2037 [Phycisphaerales bacterium]|nr:hypothetical protein [Phycisphaerales bacterium]